MDIFSHFFVGVLFSLFALRSLSLGIVVYAIVLATIPDFDVFLEPFRFIRKSQLLSHKGISHSYFTAVIVATIIGAIYSLITSESFLLVWLVGFLFYSLHVTLDALAASKIPLFYPITKKRYRFFVDRAINFFMAIVSSGIFLFYFIAFFVAPEIYFSDLINYILVFYISYYLYKFITKIWVQGKLPENHHYIPGIFPFAYLIYENNDNEDIISFRLIKKYQFRSKATKLIESNIEKSSKAMELYTRAIEISKDYLFFSKWEAIIPIINETGDNYIITLILAESYARNAGYSLRIIFDKGSGALISKYEGFNTKIKTDV
jgi:membrane-bound metal-dependent hydrolase YbcI (DUF457 family)